VIRRVVVRHLPEIRFCYEQGLQQRSDLEGRVVTRFMINGSGAVQVAVVSSSDMHDAGVESCMTSAIRRWAFPQPEDGGVVTVTYPFVMTAP
jgi:TonB family protein